MPNEAATGMPPTTKASALDEVVSAPLPFLFGCSPPGSAPTRSHRIFLQRQLAYLFRPERPDRHEPDDLPTGLRFGPAVCPHRWNGVLLGGL